MADHTELIYEFDLNEELVAPLEQLLEGGGPMAYPVFKMMNEGADVVVAQIRERTPYNRGHLWASVSRGEPVRRGTSIETHVMCPITYGLPVEYGRRPGGKMPVKFVGIGPRGGKIFEVLPALRDWVREKGLAGTYSINTRRRLGSRETQQKQDRQVAWMVARKIAKHGTKGAFMFRDGLIAAKPAVDALWEALLARIVEEWAD